MLFSLAMFFLVASAARSVAHAEDCAHAITQAAMNACAEQAFKKSDAELNALYRQIINRLQDDPHKTRLLISSEKAWLSFRDAECAFATSSSAQGTVYPMVVLNCRDRLTRARVNDLKSYLHCEEGILDCPVPVK